MESKRHYSDIYNFPHKSRAPSEDTSFNLRFKGIPNYDTLARLRQPYSVGMGLSMYAKGILR